MTPCSTFSSNLEKMEITTAHAEEKPTLAQPTPMRNRGNSTW
jgi:hypothetical protein